MTPSRLQDLLVEPHGLNFKRTSAGGTDVTLVLLEDEFRKKQDLCLLLLETPDLIFPIECNNRVRPQFFDASANLGALQVQAYCADGILQRRVVSRLTACQIKCELPKRLDLIVSA